MTETKKPAAWQVSFVSSDPNNPKRQTLSDSSSNW